MKRLENKIALVTGGAGGIGRAIASRFAKEGATVYVLDINEEALGAAVSSIQEQGGMAKAVSCDVCQLEQVKAALDLIEADEGRLDCLINNAAMNVRSDFRHLSDADMMKMLDVNIMGASRFAREGLNLLRKSDDGNIINLASVMENRSARQMSVYAATRAAMASLSRGLAVEYAPFKVRVNYLCPGFVETELTKQLTRNPMLKEMIINRTPMGRFGEPEEIAGAAVYLASEDASYVTGAGINVDGGMMAAL